MRRLFWFDFSRIAIGIVAAMCMLAGGTAWPDEPSPTSGVGTTSKAVEPETKAPSESPAVAPVASEPQPSPVKDAPAATPQATTAAGAITAPAAEPAPPKVPKIHFAFRFAPWKDVLDYFAQKADLSLVMENAPQGTFNYTDTRDYTPAEAIDLLNSVLINKGYTLVRRNRMLMVINIEDGIRNDLVSTVSPEELASKGESEFVSVLFNLKQLTPAEAEAEIRKLQGSQSQGSVVSLAKSHQVLVTDTAGRLRVIKAMLERIEGPTNASTTNEASQFEVYPIVGGDPELVYRTMQTLFAGQPPDVFRLSLDPKTNNLFVMARPSQHATIKAVLAQLQQGGQRIEVISLLKVDPTTAVVLLNKLFGVSDPTKPAPGAPQIDADPATRKLFIRGTDAQIAQCRDLLVKLGENVNAGGVQSGHIRTLPITGAAASSALDRLQEIWPTMRPNNPIRIANPPAAISNGQPDDAKPPVNATPEPLGRVPGPQPSAEPAGNKPAPAKPVVPEPSKPSPTNEHSADWLYGAQLIFVAEQSEAKPEPKSKPPAPIFIMPGPNGLTIVSEDTEALDEFERLLNSMEGTVSNGREVNVLYIKYGKAEILGPMLKDIIGVPSTTSGSPAANAAPGQTSPASTTPSSGLISGGLASGRTALATGPINITPDPRLNALFVQANRTDLDTIKQLLVELDRKESPVDVALTPKPKLIPVLHTKANDVAEIIRQVYLDRMVESPNAMMNQPGVPGGPIGLMMRGMMGGGMGGGRGGRGGQQQGAQGGRNDLVKLSLGVDTRTNSLIVAAPDALFDEVKQLVDQLDTAAANEDETMRVVAVHGLSVSAVARAVEAMEGDAVQVNTSSALASVLSPGQTAGMFGRPGGQQQFRQYGQGGGMQGGMGGGGGGFRQQQGGYPGGGGFQGQGGGGFRQQQAGMQGGGNRGGQQQGYMGGGQGGGGNRGGQQQGGYSGGGGFQGAGGQNRGGGGFQGGQGGGQNRAGGGGGGRAQGGGFQ